MQIPLRKCRFRMIARTTILCIIAFSAILNCTALCSFTDKVQQSLKQFWKRNSDKTMLRGNSQFLEGSLHGHSQTDLSDKPVQDNGTEQCIKRLPGALIIGSAKCGTAALVTFLGFHPNIVSCVQPMEPVYFDIPNYRKGLEWYRSIMPCSYSNQVTIEKSPPYFESYDCAVRIRQFDKNMKLILTVKDPVVRLMSRFLTMKSFKQIPVDISFDDYVTDNRSESGLNISLDILHQGKYVKNMINYLRAFNRSQIHIVDGQVLVEDPAEELSKVERFLEVPAYFTQHRFKFNESKGKYCFLTKEGSQKCLRAEKGKRHPAISNGLLQKLRTFYSPWNIIFSEMVNMTFSWNY